MKMKVNTILSGREPQIERFQRGGCCGEGS
jgi:hypothetical protein